VASGDVAEEAAGGERRPAPQRGRRAWRELLLFHPALPPRRAEAPEGRPPRCDHGGDAEHQHREVLHGDRAPHQESGETAFYFRPPSFVSLVVLTVHTAVAIPSVRLIMF